MLANLSLHQKAFTLALFTMFYNVAEGLISINFGVSEDSLALLGFGLDSFVEVGSAAIVVYKLKTTSDDCGSNLEAEKKATFLIGLLFLILALSTGAGAIYKILHQEFPHTTIPGVVISLLSLSFMFFLWKAKEKVGRQLDSATVMADARCSLACIKLSVVLLVGSLCFWLFPTLWWVDSVAALILAFFIGGEGQEMIQSTRKENFTGGCGCN